MNLCKMLRFIFSLLVFSGSIAGLRGAEDNGTNSKLVLHSLMLLERQLRKAPDDESKSEIAKSILKIGDPLTRDGGARRQSSAPAVAQSLKAGGDLPAEQVGYFGFWMLRAIAAVQADDAVEGKEAARVLQRLGSLVREEPQVLDVMAALNVKGWLDASFDVAKFDAKSLVREGTYSEKPLENAKAIELYTASIAIRKNAEAYVRRAAVYLGKHDIDRAIQDFSAAIEIESEQSDKSEEASHFWAYEQRSLIYEGKGNYDRAISDRTYRIEAAEQKHRKSGSFLDKNLVKSSYEGRAEFYIRRGDFYHAIQDYTTLIGLSPNEDFYGRHGNRAMAWIRATCADPKFRDGTEAISFAKEAVALETGRREASGLFHDKEDSDDLDALAAAYAEAGRFSEAVHTQERTVKYATEDRHKDLPNFAARLALYKKHQPYHEAR